MFCVTTPASDVEWPDKAPERRLLDRQVASFLSLSEMATLRPSDFHSMIRERLGDLATAEAWPTAVTGLLGTKRGHWIHRRGAMRRNVASKERQEAKYDGHCH